MGRDDQGSKGWGGPLGPVRCTPYSPILCELGSRNLQGWGLPKVLLLKVRSPNRAKDELMNSSMFYGRDISKRSWSIVLQPCRTEPAALSELPLKSGRGERSCASRLLRVVYSGSKKSHPNLSIITPKQLPDTAHPGR